MSIAKNRISESIAAHDFVPIITSRLNSFWWEFHGSVANDFRPLYWGGLSRAQADSFTFQRFMKGLRHPYCAFMCIGNLGFRRTPAKHIEVRRSALDACCKRLSLMSQPLIAFRKPSPTSAPSESIGEFGAFVSGRAVDELREAGRAVGQSHIVLKARQGDFTIETTAPTASPTLYKDHHGVVRELSISAHARTRALIRYLILRPDDPPPIDLDRWLHDRIQKATLRAPNNRRFEARLRRHGKETIYLEDSTFTYVIHDGCLVTVEICSLRRLNKARLQLGAEEPIPKSLITTTESAAGTVDAAPMTDWDLWVEVRLPSGTKAYVQIESLRVQAPPSDPPQSKVALKHARNAIKWSKKEIPGLRESEVVRIFGAVGKGKQRLLYEDLSS
jgi:hypothetical protein